MNGILTWVFRDGRRPLSLMVFLLVISGMVSVSPVSAEYGYTEKWMGTPAWLQEKVGVSTFEPKLFRGAELAINLSQFTNNYINTGKDYLVAGSFNDAKTSFDRALSRDSESFDAWLGRAYALEALKRYQTAVESYDSAIKVSKSNKNTYLAFAGKGRSSLENQRYQDAVDAFTMAIGKYQSSPSNNLTELANLNEGLADAEKNLRQLDEGSNAEKKFEEPIPRNTS